MDDALYRWLVRGGSVARESSVAREMIMLEGAETSSASEMVTSAAMTATAAKPQPCQSSAAGPGSVSPELLLGSCTLDEQSHNLPLWGTDS